MSEKKATPEELLLYEKVYSNIKKTIIIIASIITFIVSIGAIVSFSNLKDYLVNKTIEKMLSDEEVKEKILNELYTRISTRYDSQLSDILDQYSFYTKGIEKDFNEIIIRLNEKLQ